MRGWEKDSVRWRWWWVGGGGWSGGWEKGGRRRVRVEVREGGGWYETAPDIAVQLSAATNCESHSQPKRCILP